MPSKTKTKKILTPVVFRHRTYYLKWAIDGDWSIRYFFFFYARPEYEKQFVLKSHITKDYIVLSRKEAFEYIRLKCKSMSPEEILGTKEHYSGKFKKIVIDKSLGISIRDD